MIIYLQLLPAVVLHIHTQKVEMIAMVKTGDKAELDRNDTGLM